MTQRKENKESTSSLEESGELVDLSQIEVDDKPKSPYGRHLGSTTIESFTKGYLITSRDSQGTIIYKQFIEY